MVLTDATMGDAYLDMIVGLARNLHVGQASFTSKVDVLTLYSPVLDEIYLGSNNDNLQILSVMSCEGHACSKEIGNPPAEVHCPSSSYAFAQRRTSSPCHHN
jgi:hypothetical protein